MALTGRLVTLLLSGSTVSGAASLLAGEASGFAFAPSTSYPSSQWVAVKNGGATTEYTPDAFFTNSGTSPDLVHNASGTLVWSPHNLFLNSGSPATQNVTLISGATYTVTVTGSGSVVGSVGASGTATAGSPATFTATGTSGTFTVSGGPTTIQINRGSVATAYLATTGSARYGVAIDYGPDGDNPRLLAEPAATNSALYSSKYDDAVWTKSNASVTPDDATAPNGLAEMDRITINGVSTDNIRQAITATAGATYTWSGYFKRYDTDWIVLQVQNSSHNFRCWFNLATGAKGTSQANGNGSVSASWIEDCGGGIYRCAVTGTITGLTAWEAVLYTATADLSTTRVAGSFHAWMSELKNEAAPSSPIPTFGTTVTRAADNDNHNTSDFSFYSATAGLVAIGGRTRGANANAQTLFSLDDGTANERIRIYRDTSLGIHVVVTDGGVDQADITIGTVANDTDFTVAISWAANSIKISLDQGSVTTDSSATLPTMTKFRYGAQAASGTEWGSYIHKALYLPRVAASDAELQSIQTKVAA